MENVHKIENSFMFYWQMRRGTKKGLFLKNWKLLWPRCIYGRNFLFYFLLFTICLSLDMIRHNMVPNIFQSAPICCITKNACILLTNGSSLMATPINFFSFTLSLCAIRFGWWCGTHADFIISINNTNFCWK